MDNDALKEMRDNWSVVIAKDGGYCPCCQRWGKIYRRNLNASMARQLMWLVQAPDRGDGWVHVPSSAPTWMLRTHQLPTLHLWGLVEGADSGTKLASSGLWKPTPEGVLFAQNKITVKKYVYVYNNTVMDSEGEDISVVDALGDKYNYQEITANYDGSASSFEEQE